MSGYFLAALALALAPTIVFELFRRRELKAERAFWSEMLKDVNHSWQTRYDETVRSLTDRVMAGSLQEYKLAESSGRPRVVNPLTKFRPNPDAAPDGDPE